MSDQPTDPSDEARESFEFFSNEYAQALQAYAAIEQQAGTILLLGGSEELLGFIDQFIEMATRTRDLAQERGEQNFIDWFRELVQKAQALLVQVATARAN
jgi:prephenate dehydrogenase